MRGTIERLRDIGLESDDSNPSVDSRKNHAQTEKKSGHFVKFEVIGKVTYFFLK